MEFSDAPDGGIQFFESTRKFDESGKQVEYNEMKYPYELETTFIQIEPQEQPQQQVVTPKKEAVIPCATIYQTFYQLQNTTNSKIVLTIQPIKNNSVNVTEKEITLKPNESMVFDTILMADQFISAKVYQPSIKQVLTKKRNEKKIKIIEPGPIDAGASRTYYWFIVEWFQQSNQKLLVVFSCFWQLESISLNTLIRCSSFLNQLNEWQLY